MQGPPFRYLVANIEPDIWNTCEDIDFVEFRMAMLTMAIRSLGWVLYSLSTMLNSMHLGMQDGNLSVVCPPSVRAQNAHLNGTFVSLQSRISEA